MIITERWLASNVECLFSHALDFITDTGMPTPKLHMVDIYDRLVTVSCDAWEWIENRCPEEYAQLGSALEAAIAEFGAIASLLAFAGKLDAQDIFGVLAYGGQRPKLYYKHIIWYKDVIDFGPTTIVPWDNVKNLQF